MSQLAAAASATTNSVFWYPKDKDAVLVAALDLFLADALQEHAQQDGHDWHEQVMWAVDRLERFHRLVSVVHVEAADPDVVAAWHDQFTAARPDAATGSAAPCLPAWRTTRSGLRPATAPVRPVWRAR